jgi:putative ABC transport system ATP-binding protein
MTTTPDDADHPTERAEPMNDDNTPDAQGPEAHDTGASTQFVPNGALYELRGVERRYMRGSTPVLALHDVDLDIAPGEFLSLEGPSGSGKSTLLQLLGALDTPTSGTIRFEGNEMGSASDTTLTRIRGREIGFVFQQFNLIPTLTAAENVGIAMIPHGGSKTQRRQRSAELLERVGLGGRLDHLPSRMSGGEQQRVAIARALANRPRVIIADEPTGNLDSASAQDVMSLLNELQSGEEAVTIVVATHDAEVASRAGRRVRLRDGAVVS